MSGVTVVLPETGQLEWHRLVVDRLHAAGHDVSIEHGPASVPIGMGVALLLRAEGTLLRRRSRLLAPSASIAAEAPSSAANFRLDLTGTATSDERPTLRFSFNGHPTVSALAAGLSRGRPPEVELILSGAGPIARALPMVDRPEVLGPALDDVLAAAATLAVIGLRTPPGGALAASPENSAGPGERPYLARLGREVLRRTRYRNAHWRVGFRFHENAGVAETATLGTGWCELPDDGSRFYADPFPFEHDGRFHIFVEDYPHATGKAVISVVEVTPAGPLGTPRKVIEEPFHLSYPQVFSRDGQTWILPEASASRALTLYRATTYPDRWEPAATLVSGRELSDATLLDHAGQLWLFATERYGHGSTSDTLVVLRSPTLLGPWTDHPASPVLVDRRRARPGGAFIRTGGRLLLPVQDGTFGYGGGLAFAELRTLDENRVELAPPTAIVATGDWPYPRIHTLNRAGPLEVIDGIASVRR